MTDPDEFALAEARKTARRVLGDEDFADLILETYCNALDGLTYEDEEMEK